MISIQINSTLTPGKFYRTQSLQEGQHRVQDYFGFGDLVVPSSSIEWCRALNQPAPGLAACIVQVIVPS
jgi:hypothetical protein